MADSRRFAVTSQLDIEQILMDAQHRWLRPAEICEILKNYKKFHIAPESPNRPPSGSLYLFDRKVLRYFRKDGHNWRKKKDGKTVKEAHERLKCGSIDVLHCYYAHGEENENFQRRSYWMLEEDLMHIVLVHYREVKGNKPNFNRSREAQDVAEVSYMGSPAGSTSATTQGYPPSQNTDAESSLSAHTSEFEDAESDNYQSSSRYHPFAEMQRYDGPMIGAQLLNPPLQLPSANNQYDFQAIQAGQANSDFYSVAQEDVTRVFDDTGFGLTLNGPKTQVDLTSWDEVLKHCSSAFQTPLQSSVSFGQPSEVYENQRLEISDFGEIYATDIGSGSIDASNSHFNSVWEFSNSDTVSTVTSNVDVPNNPIEQSINYPSLMKQLSLELSNGEERFKKHDSFSRWMSKELGEVVESNVNSSTSLYWNEIGAENVTENSSISDREHLDSFIVSPSLSQDQCFSISDFSPSWAYTNLETKVLISGRFLKNKEYVLNCKWSCMFGEVEVPADVLADGILCCLAPRHKAGRFPFYVTCSNRLACSEIREFEFKDSNAQYTKTMDSFHLRLDKLLSLGPHDYEKLNSINITERAQLNSRIRSSMIEANDDYSILLKLSQESGMSPENANDQLLESVLREKLHTWLLCKVAEDGKGPSILDKEGQGVLHLAAALGYDWAIKPTITAGVNINFRDVHGWTALHWAASFGRERTVVALIALGAAPGAVTDPTPEYPSGRTPADLASENGHKGIAGFLAESALTSHLDALTIKDAKGNGTRDLSALTSADDDFVEKCAIMPADGDTEAGLSLKDSLSAVRNASQAVARIYQVFRVKSFHRKKFVQYGDDKCGMSDEQALSLISVKSSNAGKHDSPLHAAAIRIQNKFRGWKGRKEFLITRQRIIKIQAHVRGHQVRKHYKKIVWSVGIVEKAILRWRRKRSGLRGFRPEGLLEGPSTQIQSIKEDDYDFLQKGRRETEDRLQKALARVKSMVQYPEAREQYRRLLTVVGQLQDSKAMQENYMDELGDTADDGIDDSFMLELEELCDDETFAYGI